MDFAQLKARLSSDVDASAPYLSQIVALDNDKATVDAFDKILKNLAKPRTVRDEALDLQQFVADSKTEFGKLVCAGLDKQLKATPPPAADKAAALKALEQSEKCPTQ
jgi:hypothetical protein